MINKKNILKFEQRQKIFNFIEKNPGLHLREISRRLNIPFTTLLYHINYLKKLGTISEKKEKGYKRLYAKEEIGSEDKEILAILRQKIPCRIILYLLFKFSFSRKELCEELNEKPAILSYYIKKMLDMGIIVEADVEDGKIYPFPKKEDNKSNEKAVYIDKRPIGREKFYRRGTNKILFKVYRILITHKNSIADKKFIDSYVDFYTSIIELEKIENNTKPNKIPSEDSVFELINNFIKPFFAA